MARYHRIDGWRGYWIPDGAIAGASNTGMSSDSPCPTTAVLAELRAFAKAVCRKNGIKYRIRAGTTSNVFCQKLYVIVLKKDYERALAFANEWFKTGDYGKTSYIHGCEGDDSFTKSSGYKLTAAQEKAAATQAPDGVADSARTGT